MKIKRLLLPALLLAVAVTAVVLGSRWAFGTRTAAQQPSAPEGSVRWYAQLARAEGQDHVVVISHVSYHAPADINEAISNDSLIVGQLITSVTSWDDATGSITTWYKFNISETLLQRPYAPCAYCTDPNVPSELLPLSSGEIVVPVAGGSAVIDDVVVEEVVPDLSGFIHGQRYLLFLNFDPSTSVGTLDYGPSGALLVTTQNTFAPVIEFLEGQADPISNGLLTQYANSLTQLRAALNPVNCDPAQQQDCIDNGGTWNSTNCTCQPAFDPCIKKPWLCE